VIATAPVWREGLACPEYPRLLTTPLRTDVAIIGGGFAGLSTAYHLLGRRPGARVVVLEAERLGAGASGRTTGMLGPGVGQSLPGLVRRHGPARARALYVATLRAVEDAVDLVRRARIACELEMTGQLVVARSPGGGRRVAELSRLLRELELPGEALDRDVLERLIRLATAGGGGADPAAVRLPVAGTLHPLRLVLELADRVEARGGAIFERSRVRAVGHGRPARVELEGGAVVLADEVVVATAGYTPALGIFRGRVLPVHLQVLATEPLTAEALQALGWKGREGVLDSRRVFDYFRLTADDRIVFGGGRPRYYWGGGEEGPAARAAALDALTRELHRTVGLPGLRVTHGWTGVIGYVADALPAIQRLRGQPSVLHAVGWCGHGVALSLAAGAWVTHMLCDGAVSEDLPWFRTDPPLVPLEPVRWAGFQGSVRLMELLDRIV
jgi:gamma-glutamylputrescine oxidase